LSTILKVLRKVSCKRKTDEDEEDMRLQFSYQHDTIAEAPKHTEFGLQENAGFGCARGRKYEDR
jgi:hypothetical protein